MASISDVAAAIGRALADAAFRPGRPHPQGSPVPRKAAGSAGKQAPAKAQELSRGTPKGGKPAKAASEDG